MQFTNVPASLSASTESLAPVDSTLTAALEGARRLRFLCSGNMVRSAFAELYAKHRGCPLPVDSLGTTYRNEGLYPETERALRARGVDEGLLRAFRSRHMADVEERPSEDLLVLGMTRAHLDAWRALHPEHRNSHLLGAALVAPREIADPVLEGAAFAETFDTLTRTLDALIDHLRPDRTRSSS